MKHSAIVSGCFGKVRFPSFKLANNRCGGEKARGVYHCTNCGGYHLGVPSKPMRAMSATTRRLLRHERELELV